MDYILELILKNEDHQLDKILSEQATKRGSNPLELTMKNFKECLCLRRSQDLCAA